MFITGQPCITERPVHEAGAIQPIGSVGAGGGTSIGGDFGKLPPVAVPADYIGFAVPEVVDLACELEGGLHRLLTVSGEIHGQRMMAFISELVISRLPAKDASATRSASSSSRALIW